MKNVFSCPKSIEYRYQDLLKLEGGEIVYLLVKIELNKEVLMTANQAAHLQLEVFVLYD